MNFKHAEAPGWYVKIFDDGTKTPSWNKKGKPGYYQEMKDWEAEGNEIEPQFTAEELAEKEADDKEQALESQKSQCIQLLNKSEIHVTTDPPYPNDVDAWKAFRTKLKTIIKGDKIVTIPTKPF